MGPQYTTGYGCSLKLLHDQEFAMKMRREIVEYQVVPVQCVCGKSQALKISKNATLNSHTHHHVHGENKQFGIV